MASPSMPCFLAFKPSSTRCEQTNQLPYDDHERALKLLYALDRKVWDVKVTSIIESSRYETLTVDELFSKLKSTEIDY
jgi:hypothetical protein